MNAIRRFGTSMKELLQSLNACNSHDSRSILFLIRTCISNASAPQGLQVHTRIIKTGLDSEIFIANNLLHMYCKCRSMELARQVFDRMTHRDHVSWTSLIGGYVQQGYRKEALKLFVAMQRGGIGFDNHVGAVILKACNDLQVGTQVHSLIIKNGLEMGVFAGTALVDMYVRCRSMTSARQFFMGNVEKNVVSWTVMIAGYLNVGEFHQALGLFREMQRSWIRPDDFACASAIAAVSRISGLKIGTQIHCFVCKSGFDLNLVVGSALVDMYAKCGSLCSARKVFKMMPERNLVTWTAMITGYAQNADSQEAIRIFCKAQEHGIEHNPALFVAALVACNHPQFWKQLQQTHLQVIKRGFECDICVGTAIVDAYFKCRMMDPAIKLFVLIPQRDLVLWTTMINGYAGLLEDGLALKTFAEMKREGFVPNEFSFTSLIWVCSELATLIHGRQLHCHIIKLGYDADSCIGNSLIDMYAKCGSIDDAKIMFNNMSEKNVVCWTAIIVGCAQHGLASEAVQLFEKMVSTGLQPDHVTFVGVISACSHAGLVDKGCHLFTSMTKDYGIDPRVVHYVCMVDMYGRAGRLKEAEAFIKEVVVVPDVLVWHTLLSACKTHRNLELGEWAAGHILALDPEKAQTYVLLSSIYAAHEMWDDFRKLRKIMKDNKIKKEPGSSWIELNNRVHVFTADNGFLEG